MNCPLLRCRKLPTLYACGVFLTACVSCFYIYSGVFLVPRPAIRSDGYGYYAYLPAVFIDHDFSMRTALEHGREPKNYPAIAQKWTGIAVYPPTGKMLDKYTLGTALLQVPTFLLAKEAAEVRGLKPYSLPYQIANIVSAIACLCIGAFFLTRVLLRRFSSSASLVSVSGIVFGTSVFNYATFLGSFSHIYSFALVTMLLSVGCSYRDSAANSSSRSYSVALGVLVGLITLVRVPNIIVGLYPVALCIEKFLRTRNAPTFATEVVCGSLSTALVFSLQSTYWYTITGHIFINSYQHERFYWTTPHVFDFLFSVRKGLFFWHPILLLALPGMYRYMAGNRLAGAAVVAILVLEIYICSSWWSWWFGMGFGSRPFVDMMPFLALPLAFGFEYVQEKLRAPAAYLFVAGLILLNCILMFSFWMHLIPWDGTTVGDLIRLPAKMAHHSFLR